MSAGRWPTCPMLKRNLSERDRTGGIVRAWPWNFALKSSKLDIKRFAEACSIYVNDIFVDVLITSANIISILATELFHIQFQVNIACSLCACSNGWQVCSWKKCVVYTGVFMKEVCCVLARFFVWKFKDRIVRELNLLEYGKIWK